MSDINNDTQINRGIEFILNGGKRKRPKTLHIVFDKMVCFLKREVTIYFEFSLDVRKRRSSRGERNVSN